MQTELPEAGGDAADRRERDRQVSAWSGVHRRGSLVFNAPQRRVFLLLYYWRDRVARVYVSSLSVRPRNDENPQSIVTDRALSNVARNLPSTAQDVSRLFNAVPIPLKERMEELLELVRRGKELAREDDEEMMRLVLRVMKSEPMEEEVKREEKEVKVESVEVEGVLDEMIERGAEKLRGEVSGVSGVSEGGEGGEKGVKGKEKKGKEKETKEKEKKAKAKAQLQLNCTEPAESEKQMEVEKELDLDELFHDLAMINGVMEGDPDEESSEEEKEEVKEEKKEEEEIKSLRQTFKRNPEVKEATSVKRDSMDDLLGVKAVDKSSNVVIPDKSHR